MENFKFFLPAQFEKSKSEKGEEVMKIRGVASNTQLDDDQEFLNPKGFDLKFFKNHGFINWNHLSKKDPEYFIGEPTKAEVNSKNEFYIEGELWSESNLAKSVYNLAEILEKRKIKNPNYKRQLGWSIEGQVLEKDPLDNRKVTKAMITHVAITPTPKNSGTWLGLLKGNLFDGELEFETEEETKGEGLEKSNIEANGGAQYIIDIVNEKGDRIIVDKELNIKITKALSTSSSSGKALKKEDLEGKLKFPKEVIKSMVIITKGYESGLIEEDRFNRLKEKLKKGGLPDGTIKDWKGGKYQKRGGKWFPYKETSSHTPKKEEKRSSGKGFDWNSENAKILAEHGITKDNLEINGNLDLNKIPITNLPDNLKVNGKLDLSQTSITKLPNNLKVKNLNVALTKIIELPDNLEVSKNLYLSNTPITKLPDNLKVGGSLNLRETPIIKLPNNLKVGGSLDLTGTPITKLPDNLKINGGLFLERTKITELPDNLKVIGDLFLGGTSITKLPNNLEVGGNLDLSETKITELPNNLKVNKGLDLSKTPITNLPNNLEVGGNLYLGETEITKLPNNLKVGKKIYASFEKIKEIPKHLQKVVINSY